MLYQTYELRRSLRRRLDDVVSFNANTLRAVAGPAVRAYPVRTALAAAEVAHTIQLTHERPGFRIDSVPVDGVEIGVDEQVVTSTPFGSLLRFVKADGSSASQPKVLVVPGLAGHFATLVRATVSSLLIDHDVYVADWHNARDVPLSAGRFGLDEYIEHLMTFLRAAGPGTHLMGVCQPAVACIAAAAIMAEDDDPAQPASLILLAGPVDTRVNPGRVNRFAQRQPLGALERTMLHTVPRGFPGAGRRVYPGFLQISGFIGMDPRRHLKAFNGLFRDLRRGDTVRARHTQEFYDEYFAVLDIAAEFFRETAQRVFKDNDLPRGQFYWNGRKVNPGLIRSALFTIEGELDAICCPGQTFAAHELCPAIPEQRHQHLEQKGVGHYGVFAGSVFEKEIYPKIRDFVATASANRGRLFTARALRTGPK